MTSNSSISSSGKSVNSNTRQISPAVHWNFTLNNYTEEDIDLISSISPDIIDAYVFQEETGDKGTPHLQGYIKFRNKKRPKSVFKNQNFHWQKCRNITASKWYCIKDKTRTGKIFSRNFEAPYNLDITLYTWQKEILNILDSKPDDRSIYWYYEEKGCSGKTTFCKYIVINYQRVMVLSGKINDMLNGIIQYKETNKFLPKIILIDIPRSENQYVSYSGIEKIKDMLFYCGKYKGGMICGPNPHVIIFSNSKPEEAKLSSDRWHIINILTAAF